MDKHTKNKNLGLPIGSNPPAIELPHFPTHCQAVVWRNWEVVPVNRLAKVLQTSEENILELAKDMGLRTPPIIEEKWLQRGYITIIRANWHLLPYEQLLMLLGWSAEKLAYTLKEDDFLWVKLGNLKPYSEPVTYTPLTEKEKLQTMEIRRLLEKNFTDISEIDVERPFGFLERFEKRRISERRVFGDAKPGEVVLDDKWGVKCNFELTRPVKSFIDRFVTDHEARWGYRLINNEESESRFNIMLNIEPDPELLSESHKVEVGTDVINITSVDEPGLLRGLQWLEKEMNKRGGPFLNNGSLKRKTRFDLRIVYSYFAVYGDPFVEEGIDPFPEGILDELSKLGVNGIWLQGVLYSFIPWDYAPELSINCEKRLEGLRKLTERAADYGIGVYLYINEPRSMPLKFYEKYPELKGHIEEDFAALCTSQKPVQDFLYNSVAQLFKEVPELAGAITITMSENMTNCYSRASEGKTNCPRCTSRSPQEVIAEVNRIIAEAAHSVKPDARIICWTWGWNHYWGWSDDKVRKTIELLPDNVSLMCISEEEMKTNVGGIEGDVVDYSISIIGPGEKSKGSWKKAAERGLSTVAKVQFNNSWECSAVPYLPVMNTVEQHIKNLITSGVSGLMLGWTIGGYPSLTLELASKYYWEEENLTSMPGSYELAESVFGDIAGKRVRDAWRLFSDAFKEFPFHISVLYCAPQNSGPMNLLYEKPTGFNSTMVGIPYDDLEGWRAIYPPEIFSAQFKKLSEKWAEGLDVLREFRGQVEDDKRKAYDELLDVSESAYFHFRSTYLQIAYVMLRDNLLKTEDIYEINQIKSALIKVIEEEKEIAKRLCNIVRRDSRIGFEATNHYYYTVQDLREKVINCEYLLDKLLKI